jgi:hypothetical protein
VSKQAEGADHGSKHTDITLANVTNFHHYTTLIPRERERERARARREKNRERGGEREKERKREGKREKEREESALTSAFIHGSSKAWSGVTRSAGSLGQN